MKKILKRLLGSLLLIFIVGLIYLKIAGRDIPPPDVSDLKVERIEVPDDENAYPVYLNAFRAAQLDVKWEELYEGEDVQGVMDRNLEMIRLLEQGNARRVCQVPEMTGFDTPVTYVSEWMRMGVSLGKLADSLLEAGRISEAVDLHLLRFRFSQKIASHPETLIQSLIGVSLLNSSLEDMRKVAVDPEIPSRDLDRLLSDILEMQAPAELMGRGLKAEFKNTAAEIDRLAKGRMNFSRLSVLTGIEDDVQSWEKIPLPGYLFKPNMTKQMFVEAYLQLLENLSLPYAEMKDPEEDFLDYRLISNRGLKFFLIENGMGQVAYHILLPALDSVIDQKLKLETRQRATVIIIALQQYRRDNGGYPETLAALVPKYLDVIPVDPFDGKPFRHDAEKKIVYAVGENLVDDQGSLEQLDGNRDKENIYGSLHTGDAVFAIE